jgi:hypothetical protein
MMKFVVIEKVKDIASQDSGKFTKLAAEDLKYKVKLQKEGKIVSGGPYLDILADCYILETKTIEEMGEVFFNSPGNFMVDREVHPIGSFEDSLEGMKEMTAGKR